MAEGNILHSNINIRAAICWHCQAVLVRLLGLPYKLHSTSLCEAQEQVITSWSYKKPHACARCNKHHCTNWRCFSSSPTSTD